jgi:hypothetical protein
MAKAVLARIRDMLETIDELERASAGRDRILAMSSDRPRRKVVAITTLPE